MKLSKDKYKKGLVFIKEYYNLKDYPENTILAWYVVLENELSDGEYERCIKIILKTVTDWYQSGKSLGGQVLAVLPQARQELRSEQLRLEATTKPKELPMSEEQRRENVGRLSAMLKKTREKLALPRNQNESKAEQQDRIQREVEAEYSIEYRNPQKQLN